MKNYKNVWLNACFSKMTGKLITVQFKSGQEANYPIESINDLKTDSFVESITDFETGEILYYKE